MVFVGGLPPVSLSQLVTTPDENGDWGVTLEVPYQADWPSNDVRGPDTLEAFCFADTSATGDVVANAEPEFGYVPVVVTLAQPESPVGVPVFSGPSEAATPVTAAPAFTG